MTNNRRIDFGGYPHINADTEVLKEFYQSAMGSVVRILLITEEVVDEL